MALKISLCILRSGGSTGGRSLCTLCPVPQISQLMFTYTKSQKTPKRENAGELAKQVRQSHPILRMHVVAMRF
jgi:hypothetical protein